MGWQLNFNALLTAEVMPGQKEGDELDQFNSKFIFIF